MTNFIEKIRSDSASLKNFTSICIVLNLLKRKFLGFQRTTSTSQELHDVFLTGQLVLIALWKPRNLRFRKLSTIHNDVKFFEEAESDLIF